MELYLWGEFFYIFRWISWKYKAAYTEYFFTHYWFLIKISFRFYAIMLSFWNLIQCEIFQNKGWYTMEFHIPHTSILLFCDGDFLPNDQIWSIVHAWNCMLGTKCRWPSHYEWVFFWENAFLSFSFVRMDWKYFSEYKLLLQHWFQPSNLLYILCNHASTFSFSQTFYWEGMHSKWPCSGNKRITFETISCFYEMQHGMTCTDQICLHLPCFGYTGELQLVSEHDFHVHLFFSLGVLKLHVSWTK